jgi:hypothetical protein
VTEPTEQERRDAEEKMFQRLGFKSRGLGDFALELQIALDRAEKENAELKSYQINSNHAWKLDAEAAEQRLQQARDLLQPIRRGHYGEGCIADSRCDWCIKADVILKEVPCSKTPCVK